MNQLIYNVNTTTGIATLAGDSKKPNLYSLENGATELVFNLDNNINHKSTLSITFLGASGASLPYALKRVSNVQYKTSVPRDLPGIGLIGFTIENRSESGTLKKYTVDKYLTVHDAGDSSQIVINNKPDLIAEILTRIQNLEKKVK